MTTDTMGQTLEDFMLTNGTYLLNTGAATYCSASTGAMSCLDLALRSPSVFNDIKRSVIDNPYGSDHMHAVIKKHIFIPYHTIKITRWKVHLADLPLFTEKASLVDISGDLAIDEMNDKITACILAAAEQAML